MAGAISLKAYKKYVKLQKKKLEALLKARQQARDEIKAEQTALPVCTTPARSEDDINASQKPRKPKSQGQEQSTAAPGDLVPLVFCKYSTDGPQPAGVSVGGLWMQPKKIKQASYNFVGIFLYPISQGEVVSTPVAQLTYVGDLSLTARGGTIPTLTTYYRSTATMDAAKNVCPITSGKIFCDPDAVSFIERVEKPGGYKQAHPDFYNNYYNELDLTIGSGDTSNTTFEINGSTLRVWEVESGTDRTTAYWTSQGVAASSINFGSNFKFISGSTFEGHSVGDIRSFYGLSAGSYNAPTKLGATPSLQAYYTIYGSTAEDKPVAWEFGSGTIDTQTNSAKTATDETLGGVVVETHLSPVADPTNPDSSHDFIDYADITFLEIQGDIYDTSDPVKGEYKTTTRQISVFIEQGCKVALYSAGTPGTTGASHHFVDLAMHLFVINKRSVAGTTADIASPIDTSNLQALASFHTNLGLFFNGIIEQSVNIIDFITTMSPFFFLYFVSENGRYRFRPILPLTSGNQIDTTALTPSATFTDSDIIQGSFEKQYVEGEQRKDVQISVLFMESKKFRVGMQKSTQIRYSDVANDARLVQYDMTDCCVTGRHARNFAKLQLAIRKHSTHTISFTTPLLTNNLSVADIIKVQRVRKNNSDDDRTESDHYQITSITHGSDGTSLITAMHFPLNSSGVAKISNDVVNGSFTSFG